MGIFQKWILGFYLIPNLSMAARNDPKISFLVKNDRVEIKNKYTEHFQK